jgi:hypothetical protein
MADMVVHAYLADLEQLDADYVEVLNDLIEAGVIKGYKPTMEILLDKDKAIHLQSLLAFNNAKDIPSGPLKPHRKEE